MTSNKKLFVFDIDGTIAEPNSPVSNNMVVILNKIIKNNILAFASGKPCGYIAGFCRQLGLQKTIIIGENGAAFMSDAKFPPKIYHNIELCGDTKKLFNKIKTDFKTEFGSKIRFQPNLMNISIFPINMEDVGVIHNRAKKYSSELIKTYFHNDCVEFIPSKIDKGVALEKIVTKFNIKKENIYAFGDEENDIPMFEKAGHIITVGDLKIELQVEKSVESIDKLEEFLEYLIKQI